MLSGSIFCQYFGVNELEVGNLSIRSSIAFDGCLRLIMQFVDQGHFLQEFRIDERVVLTVLYFRNVGSFHFILSQLFPVNPLEERMTFEFRQICSSKSQVFILLSEALYDVFGFLREVRFHRDLCSNDHVSDLFVVSSLSLLEWVVALGEHLVDD